LPQVQGISQSKEDELLLNQVPPFSFMWQTSYTRTSKAVPDSGAGIDGNSQNGQVLFPQQASLFYAGRVAPGLGSFVQITYDSVAGNVHWDNTELRYAQQASLLSSPLTWGLTMNNNPTVQDIFNSTPAWQTPFDQRSNAAPVPGAATLIDGGLAGRVAGLTGYLWWKNSVYAELGLYRSAPQGHEFRNGAGPLDSTNADGTLISNAPYWRVAYEHQWDRNSLSVGAYGLTAKISPEGQPVGPPADKFVDTAVDAQYQFIGDEHILSGQTTYIKEKQTLDATFGAAGSDNATNDLKTFRVGASYYYRRNYGGALGYFSTTGSADATLRGMAAVTGFANGSPNSNGWIGELDWVPYQNVKVALQYIAYDKFNGAKTDYDGSGRNAKDNNTLYLLGWLAF
ncbi:MAG TPA: cytochrome C, partial [Burkholderiales bacterium]